jgi:Ca2+-binding EF-hand superfamily protein
MSFTDKVIKWIFKNVKIKKEALISIVEDFDIDRDGYIDIGEFVQGLNEWKRWQA